AWLQMFSRFTCVYAVVCCLLAIRSPAQTTWWINSTNSIAGVPVARYGTPQLTNTPYGAGVSFNGINQGMTLANNPIAGFTNFTLELSSRPDPPNTATATQPRIFHIAAPNANQAAPDHRLTLEARIVGNQWYADTFIRYSSASNITLTDSSKLHPVGQWH